MEVIKGNSDCLMASIPKLTLYEELFNALSYDLFCPRN